MFTSSLKIKLYGRSVDFRKSINGLLIFLNSESIQLEPNTGYIFFNHGKNRIKFLYREEHGFCLWYKRIDGRGFKLPENIQLISDINDEQLLWMRQGKDLSFFYQEKNQIIY